MALGYTRAILFRRRKERPSAMRTRTYIIYTRVPLWFTRGKDSHRWVTPSCRPKRSSHGSERPHTTRRSRRIVLYHLFCARPPADMVPGGTRRVERRRRESPHDMLGSVIFPPCSWSIAAARLVCVCAPNVGIFT